MTLFGKHYAVVNRWSWSLSYDLVKRCLAVDMRFGQIFEES